MPLHFIGFKILDKSRFVFLGAAMSPPLPSFRKQLTSLFLVLAALSLLVACEAPQPVSPNQAQDLAPAVEASIQLNAEESRQRSQVAWVPLDGPKISLGIRTQSRRESPTRYYKSDKRWLKESLINAFHASQLFTIDQNQPSFWLEVNVLRYDNFVTDQKDERSLTEKVLGSLPFGDKILRSTFVEVEYRLRSPYDQTQLYGKRINSRLELCTVPRGTPSFKPDARNLNDFQHSMLGRTFMANVNQAIADIFTQLSQEQQVLTIAQIERNKLLFRVRHTEFSVDDALDVLYLRQGNPNWGAAEPIGQLKVVYSDNRQMHAIPVDISPKHLKVGDLVLSRKSLPPFLFRSTAPPGACN